MIVFKLAWWNLRGRRARVALLLACVALAVACRVGVGTVGAGVEAATARESRTLLGGDLELAASRALTTEERAGVAAALPAGTRQLDARGLVTMAAANGQARPVELRAVPPDYPLVGAVSATVPLATLFDGPQALAQQDLFDRLGLKVGDELRIGGSAVRLAGVLRDEPGLTVSPFSAGPRVLVSLATLDASGLSAHGARIRHLTLITLTDPLAAKAVAKALNKALGNGETSTPPPGSMGPPANGVTVRTAANAQAQAANFVDRFTDFIRLTALVALLLGGVGVASLVRGQVAESLDDVAVLRVLGASPGRVLGIFLTQALIIGVGGGVLGAVGGALGAAALAAAAPSWGLSVGFAPLVLLGGVALGAGTALAAALVPLLELRAQTPLAILRRETLPAPRLPLILVLLALAAALVLLAAWDSRSWVVGPALMGTVLVAAALLLGLARVLLPLVARLRGPAGGVGTWLAMGVANVGRPGYRPVAAVTAVGLAAFLGGLLLVYRSSLLGELDPARRSLPGLFLIDLQVDQLDDFRAVVREAGVGDDTALGAMVRARYRPSADQEPKAGTREAEQARFFRSREQNLSWRDEPGAGNTITAGKWMDPKGTTIEASLEQRYAERLGVGLGDTVTFDVQSQLITATVTSLRTVDWSTFRPNFFVYLTPSALIDAPQTWVASVPDLPDAKRTALQATLSERFPNVAVFDLREIGRKIVALLDRLVWTIRLIALVSLAAGLVVLTGMALATAASRRQDNALLLVLGARRRTLGAAVAVEALLVGLLAGALGVGLATLGSWVVVGVVVGLEVTVPWAALALLVLGVALACAITGTIASRGAWRVKPLAVLRS